MGYKQEIEEISKLLAENAIPDVYYIKLQNAKIRILERRIAELEEKLEIAEGCADYFHRLYEKGAS